MGKKFPTYIRLALEFFSSMEAEILQGRDSSEDKITFRLFNNEYQWSLEEFNFVYEFPSGVKGGYLGILMRNYFGQK